MRLNGVKNPKSEVGRWLEKIACPPDAEPGEGGASLFSGRGPSPLGPGFCVEACCWRPVSSSGSPINACNGEDGTSAASLFLRGSKRRRRRPVRGQGATLTPGDACIQTIPSSLGLATRGQRMWCIPSWRGARAHLPELALPRSTPRIRPPLKRMTVAIILQVRSCITTFVYDYERVARGRRS